MENTTVAYEALEVDEKKMLLRRIIRKRAKIFLIIVSY